jgi:acetyl-CoA carboxylase carboxyl transferase subunit beta
VRQNNQSRLDSFLDEEGQTEIAPNLVAVDPLKFKDQKKYKERIIQAQKTTNEKDATFRALAPQAFWNVLFNNIGNRR